LDGRARAYKKIKKIEKTIKNEKKIRKRKVEKTYGLPSHSFYFIYVCVYLLLA
jgi:hypothetical protein